MVSSPLRVPGLQYQLCVKLQWQGLATELWLSAMRERLSSGTKLDSSYDRGQTATFH